jgi:hypothetical protein
MLFCPSVLWSCFTDVVLSICIVIMFHWCCFVHLYCDHVSLVLFCPSVLWSYFTMDKTTSVKHDHNTDGQNNISETWSQYRWTKQHQWNMITIQMDKTTSVKHDYCDHLPLFLFCPPVLWSCFTDVVLYICIVIIFHCSCFVHLYCDHVSLVLSCPSVLWSQVDKTRTVEDDHNTDVQNNIGETWSQYRWTKQEQWKMITIQMYKTTSVKHDHNTGGQNKNCPSVLWSCFTDVVLSICIVIMFHWWCFVHLYCDHVSIQIDMLWTLNVKDNLQQHVMILEHKGQLTAACHGHWTQRTTYSSMLWSLNVKDNLQQHVVMVCTSVLWSCFTDVVLSICIVIMFHWCFVHLYCDHVSLVVFCPSVLQLTAACHDPWT